MTYLLNLFGPLMEDKVIMLRNQGIRIRPPPWREDTADRLLMTTELPTEADITSSL